MSASTREPSAAVPVNVHSDTPRSPATQCRPLFHCASGKFFQAAAKAARTASVPACRLPQASGPATVSNTQSSLMKRIKASISWRFQAAANSASMSAVTVFCIAYPST
ncbi:hypothetical protein D3C71_1854480 [compost metagenome]